MNRHLFSDLFSSWLAGLRPSRRRSPLRQTGCRPPRPVHLRLEQLEARVLPTSAAVTPPCFVQAAVSLYMDGFQLGFPPSANNAVQGDIAFNTPYVQPFASLFVLAGEMAKDVALHNLSVAAQNNPTFQAAGMLDELP